jgi:transcriptional regulator with XRE-family HTH domain
MPDLTNEKELESEKSQLAIRLNKILSYYNIDRKDIISQLNIGKSRLSNYLTGKNFPDYTFLKEISILYKDLNMNWFLTGEGEMIIDNDLSLSEPNSEYKVSDKEKNETPSLLENAQKEIEYLKKQVEDKELIISLLKPNK